MCRMEPSEHKDWERWSNREGNEKRWPQQKLKEAGFKNERRNGQECQALQSKVELGLGGCWGWQLGGFCGLREPLSHGPGGGQMARVWGVPWRQRPELGSACSFRKFAVGRALDGEEGRRVVGGLPAGEVGPLWKGRSHVVHTTTLPLIDFRISLKTIVRSFFSSPYIFP